MSAETGSMQPATSTIHPSDLALDRGGPSVEAHLQACERCRDRAAAAAKATADFHARVYPATLPPIRERLSARPTPRRGLRVWLGLGVPALAAAGFLLLARGQRVEPYFGVKGGPPVGHPSGLEIYVRRGSSVFPLGPAQRVRAADALRFIYRGGRPRHIEVRIVGAAGREELFHPTAGPVPAVQPGEEIPGSAVVDSSPGAEEIVVRASDRPFATDNGGGAAVERYRIRIEKE